MLPLYPNQQILRGIPTSLVATIPDATGEPAAGLTVTVGVLKGDGTVLYAPGQATIDNADGTYSFPVTAANVANLDYLQATWSVGGVARVVTNHEIVSGYYFSALQARTYDSNITAETNVIQRERATVEAVFEKICGVAFLPRYARVVVDGTNTRTLVLPHRMIRNNLRSMKIFYSSSQTYTLTTNDLAGLPVGPWDGILQYLSNIGVIASTGTYGFFPGGTQNITVEYEHGYDTPPPDIREAAFAYLRELLIRPQSGVPDRTVSFSVAEGGTYGLAVPDMFSTGNPWIDRVLDSHRWYEPGIA